MKRSPVSDVQNIWYNAQQVDNTDLSLEQNYNTTIDSSIIDNHIGTGVLPEVLLQNVLFDSSATTNNLDGVVVYAQNQPLDNNFGNQLEVCLTDSLVAGKKTVKLCIIGLDFQNNLQYETFIFKVNETQFGQKHFVKILALLFNDFRGNTTTSLDLGGKLTIKEAKSFSLSRSTTMVAQDQQPNLFFRDFYPSTILTTLQTALPYYDISTLNISTTPADYMYLSSGDVTTQIGEKFLATTNNIQKITLLLSVRNQTSPSDLSWQGDLVLSVYPLQSDITCPTDIAPNTEIGFAPINIPIAQVSDDYSSLNARGIVLNSVPQPVDFILSGSATSFGNTIVPGQYYAFTLKRSGSANKCDIIISVGQDLVNNSRITQYTGVVWVDIPDQDLWFRIYTDAAKVSDGQAYESGHGIMLPKTTVDSSTQSTVDYCLNNIQFVNSDLYTGVISADTLETVPVPDQRTGEPVLTRKEFVPKVSLLNPLSLTNLEKTVDPLIIGNISDKNVKYYDLSTSEINSHLYFATIVNDTIFVKVDSNADTITLDGYFVNGAFINAEIIPDNTQPSIFYRVADTKLITSIIGDVNGDGIVDLNDLELLNSYIGFSLNKGLPLNSSVNLNTPTSNHTTFENGYTCYTKPFASSTLTFHIVNPTTHANIDLIPPSGVYSAADGVLVADPNDTRLAYLTSSSVIFSALTPLGSYKLVISGSSNANNGGFDIIGLDTLTNTLTIRKVILNAETMAQIIRADINGDGLVDTNDSVLLENYLDKSNLTSDIGKTSQLFKFQVEQFIDRSDDYSASPGSRGSNIHTAPDIFIDNSSFASYAYSTPKPLQINKQIYWEDYIVVSTNEAKLVPCVFTSDTIEAANTEIVQEYPIKNSLNTDKTDCFVPNDLILNYGASIINPDGYNYKVDFEVGTLVLEMPDALNGPHLVDGTGLQKDLPVDGYATVTDSSKTFDSSYINKFIVITYPPVVSGSYQIIGVDNHTLDLNIESTSMSLFSGGVYFIFNPEKTINVFDNFVAQNLTQDRAPGFTTVGYPAMKFADNSYVDRYALSNNQVRFSVSAQSFSPNIQGIGDDGYGTIVDGKIGLYMDYQTGLLTVNFTNLYKDQIFQTLSTKVQVNVFLKKAGFNNVVLSVSSDVMKNLLSG